MAWYSTGSITATNNSGAITGVGTLFMANVRVGDGITIAGSTSIHEVVNVTSDTQLTVSPVYAGTTGSGKTFGIVPVQGYTKSLADQTKALILNFSTMILTATPTDATPGRVTKVGDFGLAGTAISVAESDLNSTTRPTMFLYVSADSSGFLPSNTNHYVNHVLNPATGHAHQTAYNRAGDKGFIRALVASVWSAWTPLNAVIDNLTSIDPTLPLSAKQGKVLKDLIRVSKGHIDGLRLIFTGRRTLTVEAGAAYIPSLGRTVELPADKLFTGLVLTASTMYHAYLFESAGVADVELSTTAPAKYFGTGYTKDVDTSRRYLGSILVSSGADIFGFRHDPRRGSMIYTEGQPGVGPFVLASGITTIAPGITIDPCGGTVKTVPRETATEVSVVVAGGTGVFGPSDQTVQGLGSNWGIASGVSAGDQSSLTPTTIQLSRTTATLGKFYMWVGTPTGVTLYAVGYTFER